MERLQRSMTTYVKSLSKTKEAEDKEKTLPIAYLGATMASHGDDFEPDSEFGQCLSSTLVESEMATGQLIDNSQPLVEPTRGLLACKRATSRMPPTAGWSQLRDHWPR